MYIPTKRLERSGIFAIRTYLRTYVRIAKILEPLVFKSLRKLSLIPGQRQRLGNWLWDLKFIKIMDMIVLNRPLVGQSVLERPQTHNDPMGYHVFASNTNVQ